MKNINSNQFRKLYKNEDINIFIEKFYRENLQGKSIINLEKRIEIKFSKIGRNKSARGVTNITKAIIIVNLIEILINAKYNNFGKPKPQHILKFNAIGFLNFLYNIKIDNKIYKIRLPVMLKNGGVFQYSINLYDK